MLRLGHGHGWGHDPPNPGVSAGRSLIIPSMSPKIAIAAVATLPMLLAACGSSGTSTSDSATTGLALPAEAAHVHGIVRARNGDLLIGTHAGLFTPGADGMLARVGDAADYMGLAALPTGALLSSGHPAPDTSEPNPLGLRQSSDAGASWTTVTQVPRDDYHVIEAGAGRVYAVGSDGGLYAGNAPTTLVKVADAPRGLIDLAVEPGRGISLVAATQQGLVRSRDGGRTWSNAGDEVGLLSWARPDALFIVDAAGEVSASGDAGASWKPRGSLGAPPAALLATSSQDLVAADQDGRLLQSADGARTWS